MTFPSRSLLGVGENELDRLLAELIVLGLDLLFLDVVLLGIAGQDQGQSAVEL